MQYLVKTQKYYQNMRIWSVIFFNFCYFCITRFRSNINNLKHNLFYLTIKFWCLTYDPVNGIL